MFLIITLQVIVEDDCALPIGKGITGGRGVAGTCFVHKIAGALAASGSSLDDVYDKAVEAAKQIGSLGVALTVCTIPGKEPSQRLSADPRVYEVGMGIHGEPGREQRQLPIDSAADTVADIMVEGILGSADLQIPRRLQVRIHNCLILSFSSCYLYACIDSFRNA